MKKQVFQCVGLMVGICLAHLASAFPVDGLSVLQEGKKSPLSVRSLQNTSKPELVVFWATWCVECKDKLTRVLPKLLSQGSVSVVTIATDKDPNRVRSYLQENQIDLPVYLDSEKILRKKLRIFSVPAWAVYRDNELVDTASAFETARIEKALGQKVIQ